ncbi:MAG: hypothetical protein HDT07_02755 [Bacteroidales bacterium]|nr:hypothetical protein [Bacteroidales bacterium]
MNSNYLIHFNRSSLSDKAFRALFPDENQFFNEVFDRALAKFGLSPFRHSDEDVSLNGIKIKVFRNSESFSKIEDSLSDNRKDIVIVRSIKGFKSAISDMACGYNTKLISLSLPDFTNFEFFRIRESTHTHNSQPFNNRHESDIKYIMQEILIATAAGLLTELIKSIVQSLS